MRKSVFILFFACLFGMGHAVADNVLTVSNVNVPQGGQATLEVGCSFDTEYTAFELQIALPDGLTLLSDNDGYPVIEQAFATNHILTGNLLQSNGNYKITCRSMDNISMPTNGALFRVTVVADASLALGSNLSASITACEFTRTADSQGENLADVPFTVNITEFRTILDETSTTAPVAETNANVRVKRTIKADEWSTICLPFAMTAEQVTAAFGEDVQIMEFKGWKVTAFDDDDNTTAIEVAFSSVDAIEANTPYIIKVSNAISEFDVDGVDIDAKDEPTVTVGKKGKGTFGSFTGSYVPTTIDEECLFLSENKFWYSVGNTTMKGFRAYFYFQEVLADYYAGNSGARVMFSFDGGETTGVALMDNGQLLMDNSVYDLQGRRISVSSASSVNPVLPKGVYIVNGKKRVVK